MLARTCSDGVSSLKRSACQRHCCFEPRRSRRSLQRLSFCARLPTSGTLISTESGSWRISRAFCAESLLRRRSSGVLCRLSSSGAVVSLFQSRSRSRSPLNRPRRVSRCRYCSPCAMRCCSVRQTWQRSAAGQRLRIGRKAKGECASELAESQ